MKFEADMNDKSDLLEVKDPVQNSQLNEHSKVEENSASFPKRLHIYLKERFPLLGHGILVAAFSFSAIAYSRICRGAEGFVEWKAFLPMIFTTITLFFLVRIFDEFKDAEEDALYRKELPVPRGLISFKELKVMGIVVAVLQVLVICYFFPKMLILYLIVVAYLLLMAKEFFIADWLKKHQFWYVTSHMFIIPLVDVYASGVDWFMEGVPAPVGLLFFFAVSYMNGIVLEVGRKIRTPENEATGVNTYSFMLGADRATTLWIGILIVTLAFSIAASMFANYGTTVYLVLGAVFFVCSLPAILFLKRKTRKLSKMIEYASALWTILMYLTLGAGPMISRLWLQ